MTEPPDERSRSAIAYHRASQAISVAMEMVLPGLAGYWLDRWLGMPGVLTVVGFTGGLALGIYHLLQMARPERRNKQKEDQR